MALLNRLLVLIVGTVVITVAALVAIESTNAIRQLRSDDTEVERSTALVSDQRADDLDTDLRSLLWTDPSVQWAGVALVGVGLALLAAQLVPRVPASFPATSDRDDRMVLIGRRGLQSQLQRIVSEQNGVVGARVRVRRRSVHVVAFVPSVDRARDREAEKHTHTVVTDQLGALNLQRPLRFRGVQLKVGKAKVR